METCCRCDLPATLDADGLCPACDYEKYRGPIPMVFVAVCHMIAEIYDSSVRSDRTLRRRRAKQEKEEERIAALQQNFLIQRVGRVR